MLDSMFGGSPTDEVILSVTDETISPSGEELDLSGGTYIKPSNYTFN